MSDSFEFDLTVSSFVLLNKTHDQACYQWKGEADILHNNIIYNVSYVCWKSGTYTGLLFSVLFFVFIPWWVQSWQAQPENKKENRSLLFGGSKLHAGDYSQSNPSEKKARNFVKEMYTWLHRKDSSSCVQENTFLSICSSTPHTFRKQSGWGLT
jgi:hypothetical protein